jgi:hypothetical protein
VTGNRSPFFTVYLSFCLFKSTNYNLTPTIICAISEVKISLHGSFKEEAYGSSNRCRIFFSLF